MLERAEWHDYHSVCMYMVTLSKNENISVFSHISDSSPDEKMQASVVLTDIGRLIDSQFPVWLAEFPMVRILNRCIMPDHIHLLLYVTERTDRHLSHIIKVFKWNCNRALAARLEATEAINIFSDGYNDKIVTRKGQKDNFYNYISDNPRRYLARLLFPEYFNRLRTFEIKGLKLSLYGNIFLLNHPCKTNVRFSSRFSETQLADKEREYREALRSGGVLVSPFIHPKEKEVRERGIEVGVSFIRIVMNGFPPRFKPSGRDFELCAKGRLLLVAPVDFNSRKFELDRGSAMSANAIAEWITTLSPRAF